MRKYIVFSLMLGMMLLTSCAMFQKVTYVDDMEPNKDYPVINKGEIKIQPDDKLKIMVSSKSPELAVPFNLGAGSYVANPQGSASAVPALGTAKESGYTVDSNGEIDFPVLGKLHVEGLSQVELEEMIKKMLISKGYIKDPFVSVDFLNMKIIMIGEGRNQVLSFNENKITLLEAVAGSNGVSNNAKLETVAVIRMENGVRKMYNINLHSVSLFDSPVYYLRQNDIVYIQPKYGDLNKKFTNIWSLASITMGVTSLLISIIALNK